MELNEIKEFLNIEENIELFTKKTEQLLEKEKNRTQYQSHIKKGGNKGIIHSFNNQIATWKKKMLKIPLIKKQIKVSDILMWASVLFFIILTGISVFTISSTINYMGQSLNFNLSLFTNIMLSVILSCGIIFLILYLIDKRQSNSSIYSENSILNDFTKESIFNATNFNKFVNYFLADKCDIYYHFIKNNEKNISSLDLNHISDILGELKEKSSISFLCCHNKDFRILMSYINSFYICDESPSRQEYQTNIYIFFIFLFRSLSLFKNSQEVEDILLNQRKSTKLYDKITATTNNEIIPTSVKVKKI